MSEPKPTFGESSFLAGLGGGRPAIFLIDLTQTGAIPIQLFDLSGFGSGLSVYALSVSPNRQYLVAGTRSCLDTRTGGVLKPGVLLCWTLSDLLAKPNLPCAVPPGPIRSLSGFTSVAVKDDGTFLAGRGDGTIALHSTLGSARCRAEAQACPAGEVYAVAAWVQDRWVSLGADGVLRLWADAGGQLRCLWQSEPFPPPARYGALQSLCCSEPAQRIIWGSGDGQVRILDASRSPPRIRSLSRHKGTALAAILHPETGTIVSAGLEDGVLRFGAEDDPEETTAAIDTHAQPVGLWPVAENQVAVILADGRLLKWRLSSGSLPQTVANLPLRSWVGYPAEQATANRRACALALRRQLLEETEKCIAESNWAATEAAIEQLIGAGHRIEALMLRARLYRARGQLLLEYKVWQSVLGRVRGGELEPLAQYGLGDLLMAIEEPAAAAEAFAAAGAFRDARQRWELARQHPLFGHPHAVRGDLASPDRLLEELEKCDTLERQLRALVVLQQRPAVERLYRDDLTAAIDLLAAAIRQELARAHLQTDCAAETVSLYRGPHEPIRSLSWIRVRSVAPARLPPFFQYALALAPSVGSMALDHYALFDTDQVQAEDTHNRAVADAALALRHDKVCGDWAATVRAAVTRAVKLAGDSPDQNEVFA